MPEKDPFAVEQYSNISDIYDDTHYNEVARVVAEKGMQLGEAVDVYGDIATAEDHGYVNRG